MTQPGVGFVFSNFLDCVFALRIPKAPDRWKGEWTCVAGVFRWGFLGWVFLFLSTSMEKLYHGIHQHEQPSFGRYMFGFVLNHPTSKFEMFIWFFMVFSPVDPCMFKLHTAGTCYDCAPKRYRASLGVRCGTSIVQPPTMSLLCLLVTSWYFLFACSFFSKKHISMIKYLKMTRYRV